MDLTKVGNIVTEIEQDAGLVLEMIPGTQGEGALVLALGGLVAKALSAYAAAAGPPITPESILQLMPADIKLDAPAK